MPSKLWQTWFPANDMETQWEDECSGGRKTLRELQSSLFVCDFTSDDEMDSLFLFLFFGGAICFW